MNCFLSPHLQVVAAAAQTLEVPSAHCPGPCCGQAGICLGTWGCSVLGPAPLSCPGLARPQLSNKLFPCLQTLLNECIAPHMDELGNVSASTPAPGSYLCKMFR